MPHPRASTGTHTVYGSFTLYTMDTWVMPFRCSTGISPSSNIVFGKDTPNTYGDACQQPRWDTDTIKVKTLTQAPLVWGSLPGMHYGSSPPRRTRAERPRSSGSGVDWPRQPRGAASWRSLLETAHRHTHARFPPLPSLQS